MIFFPNCKINIGLEVIGKRGDGFHDIETFMFPVSGLCDILEIVPGTNGVTFTASGIPVEGDPERNLCMRAWLLMAERYGVSGAKMHLHKAIPSRAGLGGGSSDAAFTIKGIDKLFSLGLPQQEMEELAAQLGSDVPFFISDTPQMASGRGDILTDCAAGLEKGTGLIIVKPEVSISTAEAYSNITPARPVESLADRFARGIKSWKGTVANAFEPYFFSVHPQLAGIKERLYEQGAVYASMSGSGSAFYGIFDGKTPAETELSMNAAALALKKEFGELFVYQQII